MGRYRAIMTDTDRSYISGKADATENQRLQSVSRVRNRITRELPQDIEILEEHRPDLAEQLRETVCEDPAADGGEQHADTDAAHRALDELERALERGDPDQASSALERARDALDGDPDA